MSNCRMKGSHQERLQNSNSNPVSRALEIHLILTEIFSFLPVSDLKACRLVCQSDLWSKTCVSELQKKCAPIQLDISSQLLHRQADIHWYHPTRLRALFKVQDPNVLKWTKGIKQLTALIKSSSDFPCSKFSVPTELVSNPVECKTRRNFWLKTSSFVTKLYIQHNNEPLSSQNIFFFSSLTNLKSLKLHFRYQNVDKEWFVRFFEEIFKQSLNLNSLSLIWWNMLFIEKCLETMKSSKCKSIVSLDLDGPLDEAHLISLHQINLQLVDLHIRFVKGSIFSAESFQTFLQQQSSSLKSLEVQVLCRDLILSLPRLQNIRRLQLYMSNDNISNFKILFAQNFPVLEELVVMCSDQAWKDLLSCNSRPCKNLTIFSCYVIRPNQDTIFETARVFPNIYQINLQAKQKIFENLKSIMPNLIKLDLSGLLVSPEVVNMILTGYTSKELDNIVTTWNEHGKVLEASFKKPMPIFHSIKALRLRHVFLNDLLCLLGPLKIKSLECLDLSNNVAQNLLYRPSILYTQISEEILDSMRKRFLVLIEKESITRTKFVIQCVEKDFFPKLEVL